MFFSLNKSNKQFKEFNFLCNMFAFWPKEYSKKIFPKIRSNKIRSFWLTIKIHEIQPFGTLFCLWLYIKTIGLTTSSWFSVSGYFLKMVPSAPQSGIDRKWSLNECTLKEPFSWIQLQPDSYKRYFRCTIVFYF